MVQLRALREAGFKVCLKDSHHVVGVTCFARDKTKKLCPSTQLRVVSLSNHGTLR